MIKSQVHHQDYQVSRNLDGHTVSAKFLPLRMSQSCQTIALNLTHAQDEGVSLSATPGSSLDGGCGKQETAGDQEPALEEDTASLESTTHQQQRSLLSQQRRSLSPDLPETSASNGSPIVHHQPQLQQNNSIPAGGDNNVNNHHHKSSNNNGGSHSPAADRSTPLLNRHPPPLAAPPSTAASGRGPVPLTSPRTHMRETTKDMVTAVTTHHHQLSQHRHHHDINGLTNAVVSTVALKDIDVQMTALSGYETYV